MRVLCIALVVATVGCATTEVSTRRYVPAAGGEVTDVREIVRRVHGDPAAGAVAGALVGGLLFHRNVPSALFGATAGAAIGAAASSGSAEHRQYEVDVRFDNGEMVTYVYDNSSPFYPGERVILRGDNLVGD
jgi:outer membrane lipoprotein SlyB